MGIFTRNITLNLSTFPYHKIFRTTQSYYFYVLNYLEFEISTRIDREEMTPRIYFDRVLLSSRGLKIYNLVNVIGYVAWLRLELGKYKTIGTYW